MTGDGAAAGQQTLPIFVEYDQKRIFAVAAEGFGHERLEQERVRARTPAKCNLRRMDYISHAGSSPFVCEQP